MTFDLLATPPATDIAWSWLNAILPDDSSSPWGAVLYTFSAALTLFACGLIGYMTISGIVQSAYTGKVLGERWHKIFTPLRLIVGIGLLVPINSGFSPVHFLIKDIVGRVSINIANAVWVGFVTDVAGHGTPILPTSSGGSGLVLDIAEHEICAAVGNAVGRGRYNSTSPIPDPRGDVGGLGILGYQQQVSWSYGSDCGRFSFTIPDNRAAFSEARRNAVATIVSAIRPIATAYGKAYADGRNPGATPETAMLSESTGKLPAGVAEVIRAAGAAYDAVISEAARTEAVSLESEARSKLVDTAKAQGWISAGSYWRSLAQFSELTAALSGERVENTAPRWGKMSGFENTIKAALAGLRHQITGEQIAVDLSAADLAAAGDESADFLTKVLGPVTRNISEWLVSTDPDADPMGAMISSGHAMISAAGVGVVAGAAASAGASNWLSEAVGAGGAIAWLLDWSKFAIGALWLIGAAWAYVLPMLPFLLVIVAAITWASAIIEAMIAALLWSLTWLRQDSDDFAGRAQMAGLMLLVNVGLRPVLAVLSLCGSYMLLSISLGTVQRLFATAFFGSTGGHISGLAGLIVSLLLLTFIQWFLCLQIFGLIASLADKVATGWLEMPSSGQMGEGGHVAAAVGGAAALASRGTPGAIPPSPRPEKEEPDDDDNSSSKATAVSSAPPIKKQENSR
ncbi:DotA/TraY family protein [Rhizobium sullae]|uniref:DotA/TraY family protein n=1 Tax=Rhizobium sullae TaxID=50338 RepID=UPI000B35D10C|nr:DotA/TraY family protein [Rhizobium sullae]